MSSHRGRGRGRGGRVPRINPAMSNSRFPQNQSENRPSKVIPQHDDVCCRDVSITLDLDHISIGFFEELKQMWNMMKKSPPVVSKLHQYLMKCGHPYEQVLRLMYNCQEFNSAKAKSLPFFIIEEFKMWTDVNKNSVAHLLTPQLKIDAFKVITKQHTLSLTRVVVEVYEMPNDGEIFLDLIKCMIEKKKYKEACQAAMLFKLQDKFTVEDFILPMILQDKLFGIDDFLTSSPRHQVELVSLLDTILGKTSVRDSLASYVFNLNIPEVKWDKMHAKPFKKLIARFVKMFKVSSDLTPNLNRRRNEGALQFLIHKRYIENTFGDESWKEMVQEAIGDDEDLKKELVVQVCLYGDTAEALRWAHFYSVDKQYWPYNVKMLEENPDEARLRQRNVVPDEEVWELEEPTSEQQQPIDYHKLSLPFDVITLVDSEEAFERFLDTGLQGIEIVGIDCEWKPSFGSQKNELALMQIATRQNVFILDIVQIGNKSPHLWQELGNFLFNNCDILKLGFGFTSDILMIKQSLPELKFSHKQVGFLDLLSLWKQLDKFPKVVLPYEVQSTGPSLSTLVQQCLGRPLDKSDQFSNWEKRPLRKSQLTYAALDAYCLIEVYDVLQKCCEKGDFPFDEACYNLMTNERMPKKKPKKAVKKSQAEKSVDIAQPPSPHTEEVAATLVKVVCDTMLQGLGKNLRRCGVDTVILETNTDHMECVRYAQDEHRFILTRGTIFNKLYGYVPLGHCLKISSENVDDQLKEFVDYYKVIVTKDDVFSICQACNGRKYVKVSRSTMLHLKDTSEASRKTPRYEVDEATGFSSDEDFECEPGPPTTTRKWDLCSDEKVDVGLCQTKLGAKIQVDLIPDGIIEKMDIFYVCEDCGKVYWDGSHFERVVSGRLQGIVQ